MTQDTRTPLEQVESAFSKFLGNTTFKDYYNVFYTDSYISDLRGYIRPKLESYISDQYQTILCRDILLIDLLYFMSVSVDPKDGSLMQILKSAESYMTNRSYESKWVYISGKPGKMIKKIYPFLSEIDCNDFAIWWKENLIFDESGFTIHSGTDRESFRHAYADEYSKETRIERNTENFIVKTLACSCMRESFKSLPCHPAEAYASGDFKIYWIEHSEKITARVVVRDFGGRKANVGPIYSNITFASELLAKVVESDFDLLEFKSWAGAKLLRIPYRSQLVAPYLDCGIPVYDDGESLIIDDDDDNCNTTATNGLVDICTVQYCDCCGNSVPEDDIRCTDSGNMCESCFDEKYIIDYFNNENILIEDSVGFMTVSYYENTSHQASEDSVNENCTLIDDVYWHNDSVINIDGVDYVKDESFGFVFQTKARNRGSKWYLVSERIKLSNGYNIHKSQIPESETLVVNPDFNPDQTESESNWKSKLVLRGNYELNYYGNPTRNPDLPSI